MARLWTVDFEAEETIKCIGVCSGHTEAIGAVALSKRDVSFCITGSRDRTVKYWDLQKLGKFYIYIGYHNVLYSIEWLKYQTINNEPFSLHR